MKDINKKEETLKPLDLGIQQSLLHMKRTRRNAWWVIAFLLVLFLAVQIVLGAISTAVFSAMHPQEKVAIENVAFAQWMGNTLFFINLLFILLSIAFGLVRRRIVCWNKKDGMQHWGWAIAGFLCIAFGINFLLAPFDLPDGGMEVMFTNGLNAPLFLIAITLLGPLAEELLLREGLLRQMLRARLSLPLAIGLSSLIFGAIHGNWAQIVPATLMGIFLGLIYVKVGDIRLSYLAHVLNNSLAAGMMLFPTFFAPLDQLSTPWAMALGSTLSLLGLGFFLQWWNSPSVSTTTDNFYSPIPPREK